MENIKNNQLTPEQSEQRFMQAFNTSPIGMALVSLEGKWLDVNDALCKSLGYTESELLQKTFQDITHPEDLDLDLDYVQKMITGEIDTYQMEKRYFHKDGHIVWVLLSVSMVSDGDEPLYFVSQIMDISALKEKEQALVEKNEELEKLNTSMVGRELRMKELKDEITELQAKLAS